MLAFTLARPVPIILRQFDAIVVDDMSIEQIAEDLLSQMRTSKTLYQLTRCRHLVIWFDDGGVHYDRDQGQFTDYFCPFERDTYVYGPENIMVGYTTIAVASIVRAIAATLCAGNGEFALENTEAIPKGLRLGLLLARQHYWNGYIPEGFADENDTENFDLNPHPFEKLFHEYDAYHVNDAKRKKLANQEIREKDLYLSCLTVPSNLHALRRRRWDRITNRLDQSSTKNSEHLLFSVVKNGIESVAFKEETKIREEARTRRSGGIIPFPDCNILCPFGRFGVIETVDRNEIDRFFSIFTLMRKYLYVESWATPLSVAVFGPPGSGKSFTVKQILDRVSKEFAENTLEFNVSQFSNVESLAIAFHQAQDRGLAKEVPLIVFDEFDCSWNGECLGWLKYFLAPMQDGKFRAGDNTYRIGRAVFVFARGTAHTFEEFCSRQRDDAFRNAKGPDFVSRLRGHLDIASIDSEGDVDDILSFAGQSFFAPFCSENAQVFNTPTRSPDLAISLYAANPPASGSRSRSLRKMSRTKSLLDVHVDIESGRGTRE